MSGEAHKSRIHIDIIKGPGRGRRIEFEQHDTLTVGRDPNCRFVVEDDENLSRHHLLVEVNYPNVTLKDLGSRNGTMVNNRLVYPGRGSGVVPGQATPGMPVGLRDGDKIKAGNSVMILHITTPASCVDCGREIPDRDRQSTEFGNGAYLCTVCRRPAEAKHEPPMTKRRRTIGEGRMTPQQRERAEVDSVAILDELLHQFLRPEAEDSTHPGLRSYKILERLGTGSFGAVYKARRNRDGETVAIKMLLQTRQPDRISRLLFEREKEISVQLKHPNIVACRTTGAWNDIHFIEMEYMDGGSVWDMMMPDKHDRPTKAIPLETAAPLILQMLEGLAYAHEAEVLVTTRHGKEKQTGVVHRDVKPSNVLLTHVNGKLAARLGDFGLAKAFGAAGYTQGLITTAGRACGAPGYMAPEHLVDYMHVGPATDVFEAAATVFNMLTGRFVRTSRRGEQLRSLLENRPRRLKAHLPACPEELANVMDRALAAKPAARYANGREFLFAMKHALS